MNIHKSQGRLANSIWSLVAVVCFAILSAAAHAQTPELIVKEAWARVPLAPQNNTAVYMMIDNPTATAKAIVAVSTPDADSSDLHEMRTEGKMMKMMPLKSLPVPAKGSVELKPGGFHIMCNDLKKTLKPGDTISLVLKLDDGKTIPVTATVRALEDSSAPASGEHNMPMPEHHQ